MKVVGSSAIGSEILNVPADRKWVSRWSFPARETRIAKLDVFIENDQEILVRGIVSDSAGVLLGVSEDLTIEANPVGDFVTFKFTELTPGGIAIPTGASIDLGIHTGGEMRLRGTDPGASDVVGTFPLTVVGSGEITDATRLLNVDGDGRGTTVVMNLILNSGFETNNTGWVTAGSNTIVRDTAVFRSGVASGKATYQNGASPGDTNVATYSTVTAGQTQHCGSVYVWIPADFDGSGVSIRFEGFTTPTVASTIGVANLALRDQWQRISATITPSVGNNTGSFVVRVVAASETNRPTNGKFIYIDDTQVEQGAVPTAPILTDGAISKRVDVVGDTSYGFHKSATNLCTNSGFETNTTGWLASTTGGTATITRILTDSKFGAASLRLLTGTTGTLNAARYAITLLPSTTYTFSCWARVLGGAGASSVTLSAVYDSGPQKSATVAIAGSVWTRYSITFTTDASVQTGDYLDIRVGGTPTTQYEIHIDGVQIETGLFATPVKHTDGGTATRTLPRVYVPAPRLSHIQGWMAVKLRMGRSGGVDTATTFFVHSYITGNDEKFLYVEPNPSPRWAFASKSGGAATTYNSIVDTINAGDSAIVVGTWDSLKHYLSVDNSAFGSGTTRIGTPSADLPASVDFGRSQSGGSAMGGDIEWVAFGSDKLDDTERAVLNGYGAPDPTFSQLPGSPILLWTAADPNYVTTVIGRVATDSFVDGTAAAFGASTPVDFALAAYASYIEAWLPPMEGVTEEQYSRLPFAETQALFSTGAAAESGIRTECGWYGGITDPETGAFAIVKTGSALEDLVGERLKITVRGGRSSKSVYVFCHSETDDLGNESIGIALSRRAFIQLGFLSETSVPVEVGVVS